MSQSGLYWPSPSSVSQANANIAKSTKSTSHCPHSCASRRCRSRPESDTFSKFGQTRGDFIDRGLVHSFQDLTDESVCAASETLVITIITFDQNLFPGTFAVSFAFST